MIETINVCQTKGMQLSVLENKSDEQTETNEL